MQRAFWLIIGENGSCATRDFGARIIHGEDEPRMNLILNQKKFYDRNARLNSMAWTSAVNRELGDVGKICTQRGKTSSDMTL